ncbi:MAG: hypothetical protein H6721_03485 [Sandaracinus sp.]|nr:hypothetical protein [Sandaracinus sp.]MCB9631195.1 hypothetical protein [Sandaracinus sp.]
MPDVPKWLLGAWEVDARALPPERRGVLVGGRLHVHLDAFELFGFPETILARRWPLDACVVRGEAVQLLSDLGWEDVCVDVRRGEGRLTMTVRGVDVMPWQVDDVPMRRGSKSADANA